MTKTVSTRLPDDLVEALDELGDRAGQSRSDVLREVVKKGLRAERLERAMEAYRKREVSIGTAAKMAGLPLTLFLDEMKRHGILLNYDLEELERDMDRVEQA